MFSYIKKVFKSGEHSEEDDINSHYVMKDIFSVLTPNEFVEIQKFTLDGIQFHSLLPDSASHG